jgi:2-methylisocitrate lyase-like PEP mutase family enzyme
LENCVRQAETVQRGSINVSRILSAVRWRLSLLKREVEGSLQFVSIPSPSYSAIISTGEETKNREFTIHLTEAFNSPIASLSDMRQAEKPPTAKFRAMHESGCFVLPNPWDIGTAIHLERLGFETLATTSAGFAFSRGKQDGGVPRDEMLVHIREIVQATTLPVNADFQAGYADEPEDLLANVRLCIETGVAGLSIEDTTTTASLYEKNLAIERIRAARAAIDASQTGVVLTGRCEAWLAGDPNALHTVLDRLTAYAEAGADCLYAPGVSNPDEIAQIVKTVAPKPVNVLVSGFNHQLSVSQLADLGVRRISVGSGLALAAWGAFLRAAQNIVTSGSFNLFTENASSADLNELFRQT